MKVWPGWSVTQAAERPEVRILQLEKDLRRRGAALQRGGQRWRSLAWHRLLLPGLLVTAAGAGYALGQPRWRDRIPPTPGIDGALNTGKPSAAAKLTRRVLRWFRVFQELDRLRRMWVSEQTPEPPGATIHPPGPDPRSPGTLRPTPCANTLSVFSRAGPRQKP